MPSSVNDGGMRISRMNNLGRVGSLMAASSSSPEATLAVTSFPSERRSRVRLAAEQPGVFGDRYAHGTLTTSRVSPARRAVDGELAVERR